MIGCAFAASLRRLGSPFACAWTPSATALALVVERNGVYSARATVGRVDRLAD